MRQPRLEPVHLALLRSPLRSFAALWLAACLLVLLGQSCTGPGKVVQRAQSHPDSLAQAFVRICQRKAWDELVTLCPTPKEQKAIFAALQGQAGEPLPKQPLLLTQKEFADTVAAQARQMLDRPLLDWSQAQLMHARPDGSPELLGQAVKIQRYELRLRFPHAIFSQAITVWNWSGRHFLADFRSPQQMEGQ
jgi:hypothetical protein